MDPRQYVLYGVLAAALISAAVTDVRRGRILNVVTLPAAGLGLLLQGLFHGPPGVWASLGGLAAGFVPMFVFWRLGAIGGGDAKLMAAVGALTDWRFVLAAMFAAFVVAAVMAIGVMIARRRVRRTLRRIAVALYTAAMPRMKAIDPSGEDSPKIPFGLALCIGTALVLVDALLGGAVAGAMGAT